MKIDDTTFRNFTRNNLTQAQMDEVKQQLLENKEINASLQASILDYSMNTDLAKIMLGTDKNEKISVSEARLEPEIDSKEENNESFNLNGMNMNNRLNKEEILKVQELAKSLNESFNPAISLKENLVECYLNQVPGTFPEDAADVVKGLMEGMETFNANLQKAMAEEGFDYKTELQELTSDLTLQEKYEVYVNFLAALQTLSIGNLSPEQLSQVENYQTIRERLEVKEQVSDEQLAEVEQMIAQMLEDNTLCLGSTEMLKNLVDTLPQGAEAVEDIVTGSEQDIREKLITAMAACIAYQKGEIKSLHNQQLTPATIAIMTAAGIEEMRTLQALNAGRTTVDKVIRILKIIGGAALLSLLVYLTVMGMMTLLSAFIVLAASSSTLLTTIGACAAIIFLPMALAGGAIETGKSILEWSSRTFDLTIATWRETIWPKLKELVGKIQNWFTAHLQRGTIVQQDQQTDNDLQTVNAPI